MIEKQFLEEIRKGMKADLELFGSDKLDLLDWAIASSFVLGISYTGFGRNITIHKSNPRLTDLGEEFLNSLDVNSQEEITPSMDMEKLIKKIENLEYSEQNIIEKLVDNPKVLDEIQSLEDKDINAMKGILLKLRIEDEEKTLPWGTLIKLISLIK